MTLDHVTALYNKNEPTASALRNKTTIGLLILLEIATFASISIISPFFPQEAIKKNVSLSVAGLVFSANGITVALVAPFLGSVISKFGLKPVMLTGAIVTGGSNILFGILGQIDSSVVFITFCFIVRMVEGIAEAGYIVASYACAIHLFPDNVNTVIGVMETSSFIGLSVGPMIGANLYDLAGYGLPFYTLGGIILSLVPLNYCILSGNRDHTSQPQSQRLSMRNLLKIPSILILGLPIFVVGNAVSSVNATISLHLTELGQSMKQVGLFYFVGAATSMMASTLWGIVADCMNRTWILMSSGLVFAFLGLLCMGPSLILPIKSSVVLNYVGIIVLNLSVAAVMIPMYDAAVRCAIRAGYTTGDELRVLITSLMLSVYSFGTVSGPAVGTFLTDHFEFSVSCSVMGTASLTTGIFIGLYFSRICITAGFGYPRNSWSEDTPIETSPLIFE